MVEEEIVLSKFSECKVSDSDLVKLKMILQAMNFSETFGVRVIESQMTVVDDDEGIVTIILDMNKDMED